MKPVFAAVLAAFLSPSFSCIAWGQPAQEPTTRIGRIFIIGNEVTRDTVIRQALGFESGQILQHAQLRIAERELARLKLFRVDAESGVRPTVTVLDADAEIKDILVQVQETNTLSLFFDPGINSEGQLAIKLVLEERNFDPFRLPMCMQDILEGRAFRGAGRKLRLELFQVPVLPCRVPLLAPLSKLVDTAQSGGSWHAISDHWRQHLVWPR